MAFLDRKHRSEYLLELIEKGRCFSLAQIANKYQCSTRTIKRMIAELREEDHEIKYCKTRKKFILENR